MKKKQTSREANKYDKILKENIESLLMPLLGKYLNIHIVESEQLDPKLQTTIERETDLIRIVKTREGERFVLHIEFQSQNEEGMIYRIKEYDAIIHRKYRLEIRHYVIYLGSSRMTMRTRLEEKEVFRGFEVLNVRELEFEQLIESQIPEEIVLAILSDFKGEAPEQIIRAIIERLKKVSSNHAELKKFIRQLQIFSQLRKLDEETTKIRESMPLILDLEQNALFKRGLERGLVKVLEKQRKAVINMLHRNMPITEIAAILEVEDDYIVAIQKELNGE